jgi:hypothetical protein
MVPAYSVAQLQITTSLGDGLRVLLNGTGPQARRPFSLG